MPIRKMSRFLRKARFTKHIFSCILLGMKTDIPQTIYLKNYKPYPYSIEHLGLLFEIFDEHTVVTSTAQYKREFEGDLYLYGEELEIISITIDGEDVTSYAVDEHGMNIPAPTADEFTLEIKTKIYPSANTRLEGLYQSNGTYCTQCEAEGFRRITYYPDRPDVMTTFVTRIEADKASCPVLLGNGNKVAEGELEDGRHFAVWDDPHPKPCYLFALVAGDLEHIHDTYTTSSEREVDLYIYVRSGDEAQCAHAMESLKKSMKWDEDVYGLEYDLDIFNIVAVSDFNMGAMENKSLNIFNTALTLAHQDTATDTDFGRVEGVIAHEYFHNWSGNRVTCRDWFQLSLKEGLTVFRDQEFSADMNSRAVQRIDDVTHLRRMQFPEDAGPLSHPIRPDNYMEINNFYTMTIYEKGAEVIRMFRTLMGEELYRASTDLYFSRHDGEAATCDDWIKCMEEGSGLDLAQFSLWYEQSGTPEVSFSGEYDDSSNTYTIQLTQSHSKPMHVPVTIGLLNNNGDDIIENQVLHLKETQQSFVIEDVPSHPIPSVLRGFSAPVILKSDLTAKDYAFLMVHDSDGFNRWEAGQNYALQVINDFLDLKIKQIPAEFVTAYGTLLDEALRTDADKSLMARMLGLPSVAYIGQGRAEADPVLINAVRDAIVEELTLAHSVKMQAIYEACTAPVEFAITPEAMGRRALAARMLGMLKTPAADHYERADNMTDRVAALCVALDSDDKAMRDGLLSDFYERFKDKQLVIDKWFALQAAATRPDTLEHLKELRSHPEFTMKNPNRVRSLYASFAMNNPVCFHAADGSGYEFLRDAIVELNGINPQIAARLLGSMRAWKSYSVDRQALMKAALEYILAQPDLSPDVFEIASKSLNG